MAVRISVLGSSSSGNCTFIATERARILLDAGLSRRQVEKRLHLMGERLQCIDALILSHEHSDHICGLESILSKYEIPVYVGEKTCEVLSLKGSCARIEAIQAGQSFQLGDLKISPFSVPHDAVDPLAFTFEAEGIKVGHVTDLGYMTELVHQRLRGSHVLVMEANHDLEMLRNSPYPWSVKQRIMSRHGHLSNEMVGKFFFEEFDGRAEHIVLAHLSENNNHPEIARMVVSESLQKKAFNLRNLLMAGKSAPTALLQM